MTRAPKSAQKRALIIGVDEYPHLSSFDQLEGCVNDALLMEKVLKENFDFPKGNIEVLTNANATRDGILTALNKLASETQQDDIVVVHYSGHGSQMTDLEGDEPDGLDETIMPCDTGRKNNRGRPDENRDITDDEIFDWITRVTSKTSFLTLIFDCCHSGTISRDAFGVKSRSAAPDLRSREELLEHRKAFIGTKTRGGGEDGPSGWLPRGERYVLIAGCRDDEESNEYDAHVSHGALTYHLSQELIQATRGTTYRDVFERVSTQVTAIYKTQHPQMEGARERELFGRKDIKPRSFVYVKEGDGYSTVTLEGGAAHGMTVGSVWDIHPPQTKILQAESEPLARVEIIEVAAVTSTATVFEGSIEGLEDLVRAFETEHVYEEPRLRLQVVIPEEEAYTDAAEFLREKVLSGTNLVEEVEAGDKADACLYLVKARDQLGENDIVPQLRTLVDDVWAIVNKEGKLVSSMSLDDKNTLRESLEKMAKFEHATKLSNPDSGLSGLVTFELGRKRKNAIDQPFIAVQPNDASGEILVSEEEDMAISITNNHAETLYVTVLGFEQNYGIYQLYPVNGPAAELLPGHSVHDGLKKGTEFSFSLPEGFGAAEGRETVKLFATTARTDYKPLLQVGLRKTRKVASNPLQELLNQAVTGKATRGVRRREEKVDDWITVEHSFILSRPAAHLDPEGRSAEIGSVMVSTPGLEGTVENVDALPKEAGMLQSVPRKVDEILEAEGLQVQGVIKLNANQPEATDVAGRPIKKRNVVDEPSIRLDLQNPAPEDVGQCLLLTDETNGALSWHFSTPQPNRRGAYRQSFVIDRGVLASSGKKGAISAVASKLIQVVLFKLADPIIGKVADYYAGKWEAKNRPYRVRSFNAADFKHKEGTSLNTDDWRSLMTGKALLFVHGTFSQAHSAFGQLPSSYIEKLHQHYQGRVFALDHFTLSEDPSANIEWFLNQIPDGTSLDLDVICHSRGGLVSRVLSEQQQSFSLGSSTLNVDKVIFVASPNAGTALADPKYMGDLVDTYSNIFKFIPDNPVTDVLDSVITVVKQLAVGALKGLDGLQAMNPEGDYLQQMNDMGAGDINTRYFALAADYEPKERGFKAFLSNRMMDSIFDKDNDLVVPTRGVFEGNGARLFPIMERHVFEASKGVSHTTFFDHPGAQQKMLEWLKVGELAGASA